MMSACPTRVAAYRPYATSSPGSGWTLRASSPAATIAIASTTVPARLKPERSPAAPLSAREAVAPEYTGSSMISADSADTMMITCSECELPIQGTSTKLVASDPTIAPTVFAAYTAPDSLAASCSLDATAASASGKLAPHRIAPGSTTQKQRTRSSWNVYHGDVEMDGLIGQYVSDSVSMYAAHATAPHSRS